MKLAVFGLWHLGTVTAACTAAAGIPTVAIDLDPERIARLAEGEPPLYEPGLAELIQSGLASRTLAFSVDVTAVSDTDVVWVCHDTPVDEEDRADVDAVLRQTRNAVSALEGRRGCACVGAAAGGICRENRSRHSRVRQAAVSSPSPARRKTCGSDAPSRSFETPAASSLASVTSKRALCLSRC